MKTKLAGLSSRRSFQSSTLLTCLFITASIMLMVSADATAKSKKKEVEKEEVKEYVWPAPPSEPVIKYEREIRSEQVFDKVKKSGWKDALLGKEEEKNKSLVSPYGVHVDQKGRLLVADMNLGGLAIFDFEKKEFSTLGSTGTGTLEQPIAVASDHFGRIYVTDGRGQKVAVYDQNGKFLNILGESGEFERPVGIVVDDQRERVYVADTLKHDIRVFDFEGKRTSIIGKRGVEPGEFNFPTMLALDSAGWLYVVDSMNFRVQAISPDIENSEDIEDIEDSDDIIIISKQGTSFGQLARPKGVAVDSDDNIYVSDAAFNNIQVFNREGKLLLILGERGVGPGEFGLPAGLAIDGQNRLYVADLQNQRVQVFQYLGQPKLEETENSNPDQ
jgi:DNA-binding beta-propeller fold protein YncE